MTLLTPLALFAIGYFGSALTRTIYRWVQRRITAELDRYPVPQRPRGRPSHWAVDFDERGQRRTWH